MTRTVRLSRAAFHAWRIPDPMAGRAVRVCRFAPGIFAAAGLWACQPPAPAEQTDASRGRGSAPPTGAFSGDFDARGTEPFWAVQIRAAEITLIRPEPEPPVMAPNPGPAADEARAVWSTKTLDGRGMVVALATDPGCSDGMSDLSYPLAATVTLGEETFAGCGARASEMPREGRSD